MSGWGWEPDPGSPEPQVPEPEPQVPEPEPQVPEPEPVWVPNSEPDWLEKRDERVPDDIEPPGDD